MRHPDIKIRYTNYELLKMFKNCGRFDHPLNNMDLFKLNPDNQEIKDILIELTTPRPNVVLYLLQNDTYKLASEQLRQA